MKKNCKIENFSKKVAKIEIFFAKNEKLKKNI